MTARAISPPQRRNACPGLSAPMATGDGLLVRFTPVGTIPLAAFFALCLAARSHGNGVMEITARGSIQVRGLSHSSAPKFAAAVGALGIAAADGIPLLTDPLSGLAAEEMFDVERLAADLRTALARRTFPAATGTKVTVVLDGGAAPNLDRLAADIRLGAARMNGEAVLCVSIGGDARSAAQLGVVTTDNGVVLTLRLLEVIAQRGRVARARDVLAAEGISVFHSAVADLLIANEAPPGRHGRHGASEVIGKHRLRDESFAYGVGLPFGHADASLLEQLGEAARSAGAHGLRAASRTLIAVGMARDALPQFISDVERLGFIVEADDPRRHIAACAGAPFCASAHIASRALASAIANEAAQHLDGSFMIHVSGCEKGCAHPAAAALTIVGTPAGCALVADATARDAPFLVVPTAELPSVIAKHAQARQRETADV